MTRKSSRGERGEGVGIFERVGNVPTIRNVLLSFNFFFRNVYVQTEGDKRANLYRTDAEEGDVVPSLSVVTRRPLGSASCVRARARSSRLGGN